jgi:hypothetical protein
MSETKARYILGGAGSHWEGCEETHWDCRIAWLEEEITELRSEIERLKAMLPEIDQLDVDRQSREDEG